MITPPRFRRLAWLVLLAAPAWACGPRYVSPFGGLAIDSVSLPTFRRYTTTLHFDSVPGAGDRQRLSVTRVVGRDTLQVNGPLAWIEPESLAYAQDTTALELGRVIARIWSAARYDKVGLEPGVNWWWVDKRGGRWRSVIISDSTGRQTVLPLYITRHAAHRWSESIARFVWLESDEQLWATCGWSSCCATTSGAN